MPTTTLAIATSVALAAHTGPGPLRLVTVIELPQRSSGFHDWPADEISAIEFFPGATNRTVPMALILPDDRSKEAPARIGRVTIPTPDFPNPPFDDGISWTALRDEHGRTFEKNTADPEAVRYLKNTDGAATIVWASEGYAKGGVQPAIYTWTLTDSAAQKWWLPAAFLHDQTDTPTRGIFHNNGFESLAIDHWGGSATVYAAIERPLIQDEGSGVCRVLVRVADGGDAQQLGYPLGPAPEGTDADSLAVAEMLSVGRRRLLVLENAERPDGETVATLWWASTEAATDLTGIASLSDTPEGRRDAEPRLIDKKLLLDFSTISDNEGIGNFEGMDDLQNRLYVVEDNEHGKAGFTRVLVFELPNGLRN